MARPNLNQHAAHGLRDRRHGQKLQAEASECDECRRDDSCESRDILIVHINPLERPDVPTTAREIMNRINEISFNSSLMREMRAVAFVTKLIDDGKLDPSDAKRMLIHSVCADDVMRSLGAASKLNADSEFLGQGLRLHTEAVRECIAAGLWLSR
jgi:NTE family protein